jgi:methyl-accepting chemotaxis protein
VDEERREIMTSLFFKRRRLLVDRFQYRLIGISVVHFGLVLGVFLAAMLIPLMLKLDDPNATYLEKQRVAEVLLFFNEQLWLPLLGVFLLLAVHSLSVSHRIAGPLYRFRMIFKAVAEGNLAIRAHIRKADYLHTDERALNEMLQALEARIRAVEDQAGELNKDTAQLKQALGPGATAEVKKAAERVESRVAELQAQLAPLAKKSQA